MDKIGVLITARSYDELKHVLDLSTALRDVQVNAGELTELIRIVVDGKTVLSLKPKAAPSADEAPTGGPQTAFLHAEAVLARLEEWGVSGAHAELYHDGSGALVLTPAAAGKLTSKQRAELERALHSQRWETWPPGGPVEEIRLASCQGWHP